MSASGYSVGILGGTFDPVHNGHISIAESFLTSEYIDQLLVLLTPQSPHKKGRQFAPYTQRLRMLMAAFNQYNNIKVSDLEFTLPKPSYTFQTVRYLKKNNPENSFFLCLGEDSFQHFKKWHKWKGILEFCELLVAERPDTKNDAKNEDLLGYSHFIEHEPVAVSSSQIQKRLKNNKPIKNLVPPEVIDIIKEKKLYR